MNTIYRRNADVIEKTVDDAIFLAHGETGGLYQMNETGRALWALMAEGTSLDDAVGTLTAAFPDVDPARIAEDIRTAIADMEANDLLLVLKG